jgi:hypothetical protein
MLAGRAAGRLRSADDPGLSWRTVWVGRARVGCSGMATVVDRLLPAELWQRVQPLLTPPPARSRGGVRAVCRTATASPRSSSWPAPRRRGACCQPRSWAAARPPPAGNTWTSGPAPGVRAAPGGAVGRTRCGRPDRPGTGQRRLLPPAGGQPGELTGATPVDRGKQGSKLHLAGERGGLPISVVLSAANANDATMSEAVLDDIPAIRMPTGRRRRRPVKVHGDKASDHRRCRAYLRRRGIRPRIARRMLEPSDRLGRHRFLRCPWLGGTVPAGAGRDPGHSRHQRLLLPAAQVADSRVTRPEGHRWRLVGA